jgi:membrane-bound serine protease (ClpP class)
MAMMQASSLTAVSPGSQTGPMHPVDLRYPDRVPAELDAKLQEWAAHHQRAPEWARQDDVMTAQQALDDGFAEVAAASVLELLNAVDGTTVQTGAGPWELHTAIAASEADVEAGNVVSIRFVEPGVLTRLIHGVATPSMVYFLLVFGLSCMAFEITQPGFGFAGFAGIALTALGVLGATIAVPWLPGLALLLAGLGGMVYDVRVRRLGIASYAGIVAFLAGSVLLYRGVAEAIQISPWLIGGATVAAILYYFFALTVAIQSRDRIVATQRGLIGLVGEARGRMAPDGPVYVKGAVWRGRNVGDDAIESGSKVRVRGVDGLVLRVEAEDADDDVEVGSG